MKFDRSFVSSLIAALCLTGTAAAQTSSSYRERYPLPASTSVTSWAVALDFDGRLPTDDEIQAVANSGAKLARVDITWTRVEQTPGVYKFDYYNGIVSNFLAHGLRPILILDYGNKLYNGGFAPSTDESRLAFANFVRAAVTQFQGQGVIWEIWNEPNEDKFWRPMANVDDYAAMALMVGKTIREVAPDEWLIGPGLSGFDWPFLERCFQSGLLQYLDAVSVHPYRSKGIPESVADDYERLKAMIDQYRPAGKSIGIIDSEWGYSLGWVAFDPVAQSKLMLRSKLMDMLCGVRVSVSFAWRDSGTDPANKEHWFGMHDYAMVERDSGRAYWQFTDALKGYKLISRLDVGSPNDYCLLFACGNSTKLVAWTTDAPHVVSLPASPGSFDGLDFGGGGFPGQAAAGGVPVTLTDGPLVLKPTTLNPLLRTASAWGRLPGSAVVGDDARLQKVVLPALVSPSWKYAPVGTTVSVVDSFAANQPFAMPLYSGSLTGLPGLTTDAASVQQVLGNMPRARDLSEGARTIKVSLTTPDGATASQVCRMVHPRPVRLTLLTPQSNQLTVRVENLSGAPFVGQVFAQANGKRAVYDVTFAQGETARTLYLPEITKTDLQAGLRMSVAPLGATVSDNLGTVPSASLVVVKRLPDPVAGAYATALEGDELVPAIAAVDVIGAPPGGGITGMKALKLGYSFDVGARAAALVPPQTVSGVEHTGALNTLGMWIYGDGSKNLLSVRYGDSTGQQFESSPTGIDWLGWRYIQVPLNGAGATWVGGAGDGVVHGPVRITSPAVLRSQGGVASGGAIVIAGATVLSTSP